MQFSAVVAKRIDDLKGQLGDVPQLFGPIKVEIALANKLLEDLDQTAIEESQIGEEASALIRSFSQQLNELDTLIKHVRITGDESLPSYIRRATSSVRSEDKIRRIIENLRSHAENLRFLFTHFKAEQSSQRTPRYAHIGAVPIAVSYFVGRNDIIDDIQRHLAAHITKQPKVVIQGLGGQGKTQLALEVARQLYESKQSHSVLWIDATSETSALKSLESICASIQKNGPLPKEADLRVQMAKDTIAMWTEPYLLILDNYDNPRQFPNLFSHLPQNAKAQILITTRNIQVKRSSTLFISLLGLSETEATQLLLNRTESKETEENKRDAIAIAAKLEYLPLAIDQAGAFCFRQRLCLGQFLSKYDEKKDAMFQYTPDGWEYQKSVSSETQSSAVSVFTTYELTLEQFSPNQEHQRHTRDFLTTCAFLDFRNISDLVLRNKIREEAIAVHGDCAWQALFCNANDSWDLGSFENFVLDLAELSVINTIRQPNGILTISMHPLIAEWLRSTCDGGIHEQPLTLLRTVHLITATLYQKGAAETENQLGTTTDFTERQDLLSHVMACDNNLKEQRITSLVLGRENLEFDGLLFARLLALMQKFDKARELCDNVLESQQSRGTKLNDAYAYATSMLKAEILQYQGDYTKSSEILSELLVSLEDDDIRQIEVYYECVRINMELYLDTSSPLAHLLNRCWFNTNSNDFLLEMFNSGRRSLVRRALHLLCVAGNADIAYSICEDIFQSEQWKIEPEIVTKHTYGVILGDMSDLQRAISVLRECVRVFEEEWGSNHSCTQSWGTKPTCLNPKTKRDILLCVSLCFWGTS